MSAATTKTFKAAGKELVVQAVNVQGRAAPRIPREFGQVFREIAPLLKKKRQAVFMRDDSQAAISKTAPGGYAHSETFLSISPYRWPADGKQLVESLAHEIHHLARGQNGHWHTTLGGHLAMDGTACLFAERMTGIRVPWTRRRLSPESVVQAGKEWSNQRYDDYDWFLDPKGSMRRWAGYRLGYELAKRYFTDGFDLRESVLMKPDALRPVLDDLERELKK